MLEWLKFIAVALCLTAGLAAMCAGVFGTYRLKYVLNRMHAAGMLDTSGLFFISLGLAIAAGFGITAADDGVTEKEPVWRLVLGGFLVGLLGCGGWFAVLEIFGKRK